MLNYRLSCLLLTAFCLLSLLACETVLQQIRPALENEGEVYLYVQPFPQEADRLRFNIEGIAAVASDGREVPFSLPMKDIRCRDIKRQRLLASGPLPPGSYTGLSFKIKSAFLKTEDGEASLLVPDTGVRIDFSFNVQRRKGYVISMAFKYNESVQRGFSFNPVFSLSIPPKPIFALTGYVSNSGLNNITIFDKRTNQVAGVIVTGRNPAGMALDQGRRKAYVALSNDDTIEVIDILAGDVVDRLRLNNGDRPQELALTPDGRSLLSVNAGSNTVSFIDPSSLLEVSRLSVGKSPNSILIDQTGRRGFVFNTLSNTISVIDIPNKGIVRTVSTEPGPLRGQFNRRGDRLYVIQDGSSYLLEIDAVFYSVVRRDKVKFGMNSIKVDTRTDYIYLGRRGDISVEVYDPFTFVPIDFISTAGDVHHMTIDGEQNYLYLVNSGKRTVMVVNLVSRKMIAEFDVGEDPYWVTMIGER
jgi:YVTN family beta-propeller protein